jgi:general secretion pathway protein G
MKIINSKSSCRLGGFTLVELLLVLVILAVLAAIVLPSMARRGEDARETAAKVDVSNIATALNVFEVDNGYYPKGADALQALIVKPREAGNWKGPYLQKNKVPVDPWRNPYVYELPGKHNPASFDLYSKGRDGQKPIGNWDN